MCPANMSLVNACGTWPDFAATTKSDFLSKMPHLLASSPVLNSTGTNNHDLTS